MCPAHARVAIAYATTSEPGNNSSDSSLVGPILLGGIVGLAAALLRAVPEWQPLLGSHVQTSPEEDGWLGYGKAIIFGRGGVRSCQRHVNARMSFCEGL